MNNGNVLCAAILHTTCIMGILGVKRTPDPYTLGKSCTKPDSRYSNRWSAKILK